ncbi:MAG TPA: ParB/RepB/Spo0J family partition protein [bacterium]|nr:ParB/RepB/Spo0J family partition protein [bacterium]HPN31448.1 ParB/RepB/Spo0J family partition protein [bacterium]
MITTISLKLIHPDGNIRQTDIESAEFQELKTNIMEIGLLNPLTVREISKNKYELISGYRRYYALRELDEKAVVPVNVLEYEKDDVKFEVARCSENIHRKDLTAIEEAEMFNRMSKIMTVDEMITLTGKSKAYIRERVKIIELPEQILEMIRNNKMSLPAAGQLTRVSSNILNTLLENEIFESAEYSFLEIKEMIERNTYLLKNAQFDKTECATCDYNTAAQIPLFDNMQTDEERCQNPVCFLKKIKEYQNLRLKGLEEKGYEILSGTNTRGMIFLGHINDNIPKKCNKRAARLDEMGNIQIFCYDPENCAYHKKDYAKSGTAHNEIMSGEEQKPKLPKSNKFTEWRDKFVKNIVSSYFTSSNVQYFSEPLALTMSIKTENTSYDFERILKEIEIETTVDKNTNEEKSLTLFDVYCKIAKIKKDEFSCYRDLTFNSILNFVEKLEPLRYEMLTKKIIENFIDRRCSCEEAVKLCKTKKINIAEHNPVCEESLDCLSKEQIEEIAVECGLKKFNAYNKTGVIKKLIESGKAENQMPKLYKELFGL